MNQPLVILFHRLGPYHVARLQGASTLGRVVCVELAAQTDIYAWEGVEAPVERITCFSGEHSRAVPFKRMQKRIAEILGGLNPRAVAINGWWDNGALAALGWCNQQRVPAILMSESQKSDGQRSAFREAVKRSLVKGYAAGLVGGITHREYLMELGMPSECIFQGYDAVDNSHFEREAKNLRERETELRHELGLPRSFFLASARFISKKNLPLLIRAYGRYRKLVDAPWDLVILGDGPDRPIIEGCIKTGDMGDVVHLPGFLQLKQILPYYALASAFVHPSTNEQWGLVLNEAMASGLPAIISNACGSAQEMIQHRENGLLFDPLMEEQLTGEMVWLHQHPEERLAMAQAARETIRHYGPEAFGKGIWNAVAAAEKRGVQKAGWGYPLMKLLYTYKQNTPGGQVS